MMIYTNKQLDLMRLWQRGGLKRLNILEGSVSSGKTWISLVLWAFWVGTSPADKLYLMCGKSLTTLKRNCLVLLQELVGERNFTFSVPAKEGFLFGRRVLLEGANDQRSESKIRGLSLQGAYCDELTLFPRDFFAMLLSRLRLPGAKLIATTNPDSPRHWLKTDYIDRADELDLLDVPFAIDDNTTLPDEYIKNIKREYTGVFYERFILGRWKAAEGVIYEDFANNTNAFIVDKVPEDIAFAVIGMDFGGNKSANAIVCTGFTKGLKEIVVLDEYYRKETLSPLQLQLDTAAFVKKCQAEYKDKLVIADMYCDSAEQILIKGVKAELAKQNIPINVHNARKSEIIERIRFTLAMMATGRFKIMRRCEHLAGAFCDAVWNDKSATDSRLDDGTVNIDSLDAFEYSVEHYMSQMVKMR